MHQEYLHYLGNESNESILEAYGLKAKSEETMDKMKPRQCPNCSELNKIDSKFCVKCRMVLSYDAYTETIQDNSKFKDEISQLRYEHAIQMKQVRDQIELENQTTSNKLTQINSLLHRLESYDERKRKSSKSKSKSNELNP